MEEKLTFAQAKKLLDSDPGAILVDVRTEEEFSLEHALGAVWLPLEEISPETAADVIPSKDNILLLYCRTGNRSGKALEILKGLGYSRVYNLGGLNGWPYGMDFGI